MDIKDWQKVLIDAVEKRRFPKGDAMWEKYEFLRTDVEDVKIAMLVEEGRIADTTSNNHFSSVDKRLGGVFLNLFRIVDQRGSNVEEILKGVLGWLNDHSKKSTSEERGS